MRFERASIRSSERRLLTSGVNSLPSDVRAMAIRKTATFDAFTPENDPHGEHDFGNFEIAGQRFFFKIDYFDPNLEFGSDDPGRSGEDDARAHPHARGGVLSHAQP